MNESLNKFWSEDWVELQKKYWHNWNSFAEQAGGKPENPWSAGLDHWWQAVSGAVPKSDRSMLDHMLDQSKRYFEFSDLFSRNASKVNDSTEEWKAAWNPFFEQLQNNLSSDNFAAKAFMPDMDAWKDMSNIWSDQLNNLPNLFNSDKMNFKMAGLGDTAGHYQEHFQKMLSMPAIGEYREKQGDLQKAYLLWMEFMQAQSAMAAHFTEFPVDTVKRLQARLDYIHKEGGEDGQITNSRDLYNLWVDVAEEVYADYVNTEDYSTVHGLSANALNALKRHVMEMTDDQLEQFNLPSRREVNTMQARSMEHRRELRKLRKQLKLDERDYGQMHEQLDELVADNARLNEVVAELQKRQDALEAQNAKLAEALKAAPKKALAKKAAPKAKSTTTRKTTAKSASTTKKAAPKSTAKPAAKKTAAKSTAKSGTATRKTTAKAGTTKTGTRTRKTAAAKSTAKK